VEAEITKNLELVSFFALDRDVAGGTLPIRIITG